MPGVRSVLRRLTGADAAGRQQAFDKLGAPAIAALDGRDARLAEVIERIKVKPAPDVEAWATRLEARRRALLASSEEVTLIRADGPRATTVAEVCSRTSKDSLHCRVLLDLVKTERPTVCIEMGTSIGVSGSYLAAGLKLGGGGRLVTLDRQEHVAAVVRRDLAALGLDNVEIVLGGFDETFPAVVTANAPIGVLFIDGNHHEEPTMSYFETALPHLTNDAVVVFDDIHWSEGMERAWARIQAHPTVVAAAPLGHMGIVRVRTATA
jgi:predicted O-methyltransferase YrrM